MRLDIDSSYCYSGNIFGGPLLQIAAQFDTLPQQTQLVTYVQETITMVEKYEAIVRVFCTKTYGKEPRKEVGTKIQEPD